MFRESENVLETLNGGTLRREELLEEEKARYTR